MTALVKRESIENLVLIHNAISERLEAASNHFSEVIDIIENAKLPQLYVWPVKKQFEDAKKQIFENRQSFWRYAAEHSGLLGLMNASQKKKFQEDICSPETLPEFSVSNIEATFWNLFEKQEELFYSGCKETVFELLKFARNSRKKTNKNNRNHLDSKLIITYGGSHAVDIIIDLEKIFQRLDGNLQLEALDSFRRVAYQRIYPSYFNPQADEIKTEYISVKKFKNGNLHLNILKGELLDRLNVILNKEAESSVLYE